MKIYLLRHGTAQEREEAIGKGLPDAERALLPKGKEKNLEMLNWFKDQGIEFDALMSSPYRRALQTAEQMRPVVKGDLHLAVVELIPSAPVASFGQWLKTLNKNYRSILVVGHEPMLSGFASWLCAGAMSSFIELKKSGCLCLEVESLQDLSARSAELKWTVNPKLLKPFKKI